MSKYTAEQVNKACREMMAGVDPCHLMIDDILREYAAHLARQSEWPSDEDVERAHKAYWDTPDDHKGDDRHAIRAALQSVRLPAGVVSDTELCNIFSKEIGFESGDCQWVNEDDLMRVARRVLASRHAPTKD